MTDPTSETQRRLRRLEDRVEIGELIARYGRCKICSPPKS